MKTITTQQYPGISKNNQSNLLQAWSMLHASEVTYGCNNCNVGNLTTSDGHRIRFHKFPKMENCAKNGS